MLVFWHILKELDFLMTEQFSIWSNKYKVQNACFTKSVFSGCTFGCICSLESEYVVISLAHLHMANCSHFVLQNCLSSARLHHRSLLYIQLHILNRSRAWLSHSRTLTGFPRPAAEEHHHSRMLSSPCLMEGGYVNDDVQCLPSTKHSFLALFLWQENSVFLLPY